MANATGGKSTWPSNQQNENFDRKTQAEEIENIKYRAFKFSYDTYCSSGIKTLLEGTRLTQEFYEEQIRSKKIEIELQTFSKIYTQITTVPSEKSATNPNLEALVTKYIEKKHQGFHVLRDDEEGGISGVITEIVKNYFINQSSNDNKYILYIEGPVGCYKNRLLQYLYLYLVQNQEVTRPMFYIDFSKYEPGSPRNFQEDCKKMEEILEKHSGESLFLLDNIRGFQFYDNQNAVYSYFQNMLENIANCKIISSRDVYFNRIADRDFELKFGNKTDYKYRIKISSMNMVRKEEAKEFIKDCMTAFKIDRNFINRNKKLAAFWNANSSEWRYEELREYLTELEIITLDAYQFKMIINILNIKPEDENITLNSIYEKICNSLGGNLKKRLEDAYKFDYTKDSVSFDWIKNIGHKSVLDYMIAQYYINKILIDTEKTEDKREYNLPNVTFPKDVTRFIVSDNNFMNQTKLCNYLNKGLFELKIDEGFGILTTFVFILGRIICEDAKRILKNFLRNVQQIGCEQLEMKKKARLFLIRSIFVSLIYQSDKGALKEYIRQLISCDNQEDIATFKDVNIGFHLDYYGDEKIAFVEGVVPTYKNGPINKCTQTLRKLWIDLKKRIDTNNTPSEKDCSIAILQLITCCQIIQKIKFKINRFEPNHMFKEDIIKLLVMITYGKYDIYKAYLDNTSLGYLQEILRDLMVKTSEEELKKCRAFEKVDLYNKFSDLCAIGRKGWLERNLTGYNTDGKKHSNIAESVAEHIYNCWLMGYIFLPETEEYSKNFPDYNKETIMELLLIHDLGEVIIGDLTPLEKESKDNLEKLEEEKREVKKFLKLNGRCKIFNEWKNAWGSNNRQSVADNNRQSVADIAKDIDKIQAVYRYLCYYTNPDSKINEDLETWLNELSGGIKSELGKKIRKYLIYENERFINVKDEKSMNLLYKLYEIKQRTSQQ